jgi:hypothetical protein
MFVVVGTVALATIAVLIVAAGDSASKIKRYPQRLKIGSNANMESFRFILAYFGVLVSLLYERLYRQSSSEVLSCCGTMPILAVDHKVRDLERQMSQKERIMCNHYLPPILLRAC